MQLLNQPSKDTQESLELLWRWLTIPLFLYCAGLWVRSQSDNYELLNMVAKDHDVAVVTGLFATPVAFVSLWLASSYASLSGGQPLVERIPKALEKGLDGRTGERFRIALFFGVWTVILGSQIHFVHLLLTGSIVDTTPDPHAVVAKGLIQMLILWPKSYLHDFRFGGEHGPTYFPVLQSWLCLLLVAALVVSFVAYVSRRLRN